MSDILYLLTIIHRLHVHTPISVFKVASYDRRASGRLDIYLSLIDLERWRFGEILPEVSTEI